MENDEDLAKALLRHVSLNTLQVITKELNDWVSSNPSNSLDQFYEINNVQRVIVLALLETVRRPD